MVDLFMGHCDGLKQHHASPAALRTLFFLAINEVRKNYLAKLNQ
jgi:hypothetical protein